MKITILLFLLFLTFNLFARSITWNEIQNLAIENSPEIKSSEKSVDAVRKLKHASYAGHLPSINLFAQEFASRTTLKDRITLESNTDGRKYGIQANMNVFDGLNTTYTIKKASNLEKKSFEQLNLTKNDFYYKLRKTFIDLYITQEKIKLALKIKKRKSLNIRFVKLKYKGGLEPKWSLDKARAEFLEISDEAQELNIERNNLRNTINSLIGVKRYLNNKNILLNTKSLPRNINFEIDKKVNNCPQLKILEQDNQIAKNDLKISYSEFSPTVSLAFENSLTKTDGNPNREERSIALNINIPIFNGLSSYNKVASNRYNVESYQYRKKAIYNDLASRLKRAIEIYEIKAKKIPTSKKLLKAATSRKEVIDKQYRSGSKSFINWEQAEIKLIEAEKNEINILKDALHAHTWLMYVSGKKIGEL